MAKKHSTTALTAEQKQAQDARYAEGHKYDYVIVGTGSSALTVGALLANQGYKICMLEAHDIPGGYLQSFKMGDYAFCAQVHYIWGAAPGGKIYEFLKRIGLEKDITFNLMDTKGYDVMAMPDGKRVQIPYGFEKLVENIEAAYPGQGAGVKRFTDALEKIRKEMAFFPNRKLTWMDYLTKAYKMPTVIKYRNATVQDLYNEFNVGKEAQTVLMANAGDFMEPPERLSIFMFAALFGGYNTGSYYPTKHFKYYVDRLVQFITDHPGCHVYYETEVTSIVTENGKVARVETKDGKTFTADKYICNIDPALGAALVKGDNIPDSYKAKLKYEQSKSGVMIYLGLKDIDMEAHGFGSFNIWHHEQWDINQAWKEQLSGDFTNPWIFMSTPTLHTDAPGTAPAGRHILEIATVTDYKPFKEAQDRSYTEYLKLKNAVAEKMLEIVEKKYIPNLKQHIDLKVIGTSVTNEDFIMAPGGNAYGATMTPSQVKSRIRSETPFENMYWCNATSGWSGVYGTVTTGVALYAELTGDEFYDPTKVTDAMFIADLPKLYPNQF